MYPFYFEITYGYWNTETDFVEKKAAGFLYEHNFSAAAGYIESIYGDDLLSIDALKIYGESGDLFTMSIEAGRAAIAAYEEHG